jgi:hypothetical protein
MVLQTRLVFFSGFVCWFSFYGSILPSRMRTCRFNPSFRLRKMLYHIPIQINFLSISLNLLHSIIIRLRLLSHFILQLLQILLQQIVLIIKQRLMLVNFLLKLMELQGVNSICHHINLLLHNILKIFMLILRKHLKAREGLSQVTLTSS